MSLGKKAKIVNTKYDPNTNSSESEVIYLPDYMSILKEVKDIRKTILELDGEQEHIRDNNWDNVIQYVNGLTLHLVRYIKDNKLDDLDENNVTGSESFNSKFFIKPQKNNTLNEQDNNITDPKLKEFIDKRLNSYNDIEKALTIIVELLKKRKAEDENTYMNSPSFDILTPTQVVIEYLKDIIRLLK